MSYSELHHKAIPVGAAGAGKHSACKAATSCWRTSLASGECAYWPQWCKDVCMTTGDQFILLEYRTRGTVLADAAGMPLDLGWSGSAPVAAVRTACNQKIANYRQSTIPYYTYMHAERQVARDIILYVRPHNNTTVNTGSGISDCLLQLNLQKAISTNQLTENMHSCGANARNNQ